MALSNVLFSGWHPFPVIACSKGKLPSTVIHFLFFCKVVLTTFVLLFHLHCFCFLQLLVLMLKKTLTRQTAYDGRTPASPSLVTRRIRRKVDSDLWSADSWLNFARFSKPTPAIWPCEILRQLNVTFYLPWILTSFNMSACLQQFFLQLSFKYNIPAIQWSLKLFCAVELLINPIHL